VTKTVLGGSFHQQQAARSEAHVQAPLASLLGEDKPPFCAERPRGDQRILAELRLIVAVHAHAIEAASVVVEERVVEWLAHELQRELEELPELRSERTRGQGLAGVGIRNLAAPANQSRLQ